MLDNKHLLLFPTVVREFYGGWVHIFINGSATSVVKEDQLWVSLMKVGSNLKYLSSEAKKNHPHGNLLHGIVFTADLQSLFYNLGNDVDPQRYKDDVAVLHRFLEEISPHLKDPAIILRVGRWKKFLSDSFFISRLNSRVQYMRAAFFFFITNINSTFLVRSVEFVSVRTPVFRSLSRLEFFTPLELGDPNSSVSSRILRFPNKKKC